MQITEGRDWSFGRERTQHAARYGIRSRCAEMVSVQFGRRSGIKDGSFRVCGLRHGMDDGCVSREGARGFQPRFETSVRVHMFMRSNEALHRTAICAWRFALEFLVFISQIVAVGELWR